MAHSIELVQKAHGLRRTGESLISISRKLGISKSTASEWCRNVELPNEIKVKMHKKWESGFKKGIEVMRIRRANQQLLRVKDAKMLVESFNIKRNKPLLQLIASILFWCEGGKRQLGELRLTNSDPTLVSTFLFCLRKGFGIDESKLRICIHLHEYHDEYKQQAFWSKITNIPLSQFHKSYNKPHTSLRKRESYQGCITLHYFEAALARKFDALYHALAFNLGASYNG